jgi:putative transposase
VKEASDKIWPVSFVDYDLGFFDQKTGRLATAENRFVEGLSAPFAPTSYALGPTAR